MSMRNYLFSVVVHATGTKDSSLRRALLSIDYPCEVLVIANADAVAVEGAGTGAGAVASAREYLERIGCKVVVYEDTTRLWQKFWLGYKLATGEYILYITENDVFVEGALYAISRRLLGRERERECKQLFLFKVLTKNNRSVIWETSEVTRENLVKQCLMIPNNEIVAIVALLASDEDEQIIEKLVEGKEHVRWDELCIIRCLPG